MMMYLLIIFIFLKTIRQLIESFLAYANKRYYQNKAHQEKACRMLGISDQELQKTLAYSNDRYVFSQVSGWIQLVVLLAFISFGGLGVVENWALSLSQTFDGSKMAQGLLFFAGIGLLSFVVSLPFDIYATFVLEEKHGFNRQTIKGYINDTIKSLLIGAILGGLLLSAILKIMSATGQTWWIWAWAVTSVFSLVAAWLYPTLLAPLFNKFTPLESGALKDEIEKLATKIGFKTDGIFVMDASRRSSHGNAYFTGLFGKKRIVLFDTLLESMNEKEIVAVLAHELGHFKLNHVRWALIRGITITGLMYYLLSVCLPIDAFYHAFYLSKASNFAALMVFSLWVGTIDFYLAPISSWLSRRNEFAADAFAMRYIENPYDLCHALIKLRDSNKSMPISHPLYSAVYHSHPPMVERLEAMGYNG